MSQPASKPAGKGQIGPKNNLARAMAILSHFVPENNPCTIQSLIEHYGMGRSTGFALIKALLDADYLTKNHGGLVSLGQEAKKLAFAPLESEYAKQSAHQPLVVSVPDAAANSLRTARTDEWEPGLLKRVNTDRFKKPGPWHIGFSNASLSNPWRKALVNSIHYAERIHHEKIRNFSILHADDDPILQLEQIDQLVASNIDLLIISITTTKDTALSDKLNALADRGLPIIAVDRRPGDAQSLTSFVTASDRAIGRLSAHWLAERLKGQGRIWMLSGFDGASPAVRRRTAAFDSFFDYPDITIDAMTSTLWTEETGYLAVRSLYDTHGYLPDAIWCDSGLQGVGALKFCLEQSNQTPLFSGGDINEMYKLAITHKCPFVAVDYPATMGARALETALDILQGVSVTERREVPVEVILPRGMETDNIKADQWAERHVRWDMPDDAILSQGASLKSVYKTDAAAAERGEHP